jgi:hypothetical protein
MKAKMSLLIPLLTIVGLVACTAAIPASSTTTLATASTTTTTANTASPTSGPVDHLFFDHVEGLNTDTNKVIYSQTFDAGAYSEVTYSQKLSEPLSQCGNEPCINAYFLILAEWSVDGISWNTNYPLYPGKTSARYVRIRAELRASDQFSETASYAYPGSILLFARFSN